MLLSSPRPALQTGWLQEPETSDRPRPISRPSELPPSFPRTCQTARPDGPVCAHCGPAGKIAMVGGVKRSHRDDLYTCKTCRSQFTVTTGTFFERTRVP